MVGMEEVAEDVGFEPCAFEAITEGALAESWSAAVGVSVRPDEDGLSIGASVDRGEVVAGRVEVGVGFEDGLGA